MTDHRRSARNPARLTEHRRIGQIGGPNVFHPYVPGFIDIAPDPAFPFETFEDLCEAPQMKRFMQEEQFEKFSYAPYPNPRWGQDCHIISAHFSDGKHWVVGYMDHLHE